MTTCETFCRQLAITHPIIQAPMVGVSTPALAAAVSNAGGLGSIGIGASAPAAAREMIRATRALTDRPFNVNVFCHQGAVSRPEVERAWLAHLAPRFAEFGARPPATLAEIYPGFAQAPELLDVVLAEKPAVLSCHFGLPPKDTVEALRGAGIAVWACVTSVRELALARACGVDAVIAQGVEAGGHRGVFDPWREDDQLGTFALVRQLSRDAELPVIAAGGIMDGAGMRAAMDLGAAAVQLGTAFILCPESAANAAYRRNLQGPLASRTRITSNISGRPARGLPNRFYAELDAGAPTVPDYPIAYDAGKALGAAAAAAGCEDFAVQWAGQGAPLARDLPAAELVRRLVAEWRR
ncbi:NAD(P)H-dependent flavin oxidoreductase [Parahaliea mediterranea]|uniref:Nitronate monooxygenase n=1 Tax=Parahaliea mediterranea TaxID=651086 RepID=A0A939INR6_9GAMM|nr:nitronate monooxygenase [Parahaliea mediterranea]MBN7798332.1 nitronate monooxygenase [Parahaliea mediterranea]